MNLDMLQVTKTATVEQAIEAFLFDRRSSNLRAETLVWYKRRLAVFATFARDKFPGAGLTEVFTAGVVRRYKIHLGDRGLAAATVNANLRALGVLARFLEQEEVLEKAPKIEQVREDRKLPRVLSDLEITQLLCACDEKCLVGARDRSLMLLLIDCGPRIGELCRASLGDLDLENRTLKVLRKCRQEQRLSYGAETAKALVRYLKLRAREGALRDDAPLFIGRNHLGLTRGQAEHRLEYYQRKARIEESCSPHVFRRTFATRQARAGANLFAVQAALGHSQITTTQAYVRADDSDLAAMQKQFGVVDGLLGRRR